MRWFGTKKINIDEKWFNSLKKDIEESYLRYKEPWKQAGFMEGEDAWEPCRKPVADCVFKSGTFLDISCSNGYFLESLLKWTSEKGLSITPYGVDLSEKLLVAAKTRLPKYSENFFLGAAPYWAGTIKFDFVRTELSYVLEEAQEQYLHKLFNTYVAPEGKLLLTEYRSKKESDKQPWANDKVLNWGFRIENQCSGFYANKELTRVLVVTRISVY